MTGVFLLIHITKLIQNELHYYWVYVLTNNIEN